ncbi:MAG: gliding motility-associated C-terminal domain-containing protein [Flavobacteriaceae bacterium]|nr:gliding motility-associated C-terminal domain-containing protein [Flavobacteriaceae bacterium]
MKKLRYFITIFLSVFPVILFSQEVTLLQQFNGHYDYLAFGNTLNIEENGGATNCEILAESSADFQLQAGQQVIAAYLYWAGSGDGDFEVSLNGNPVIAEREFSYSFESNTTLYNFFAAFTDVTSIITANGNGNYTLSNLDLQEDIQPFCQINGGTATNFGGWAVIIIYEDATLPLNQVSIFDGLQAVSQVSNTLEITLSNLNVLDNTGAKIGFLAWEGDESIANNETLSINGNLISNPPLNPEDNAFNGTNSFTGSDQLYNMDIDFYNIENNINPGDTNVVIQLTSDQDLVMVNTIITVLNTELPDATIEIDTLTGGTECGDRDFEINYTVYNTNSSAVIPVGTSIAFYADVSLVGQAFTQTEIAINGSETGTINVTIPNNIPADFILKAVVDDVGDGSGLVNELDENNNEFILEIHLLVFPQFESPINLELCNVLGIEVFNLTEATSAIDPIYTLSYHTSEEDAQNNTNNIIEIEAYENIENPQTIFIRVANEDCFLTDAFEIEVIECPLPDATVTINNTLYACRDRDLLIEYTVYNLEATGILPANTPITFYINGSILAQSETQNDIEIDGSESYFIEVTLPEETPSNFEILVVVDDTGNGIGIIEELNEINNDFILNVEFGSIPPIVPLPDLLECDEGFDTATFDLTVQNDLISTDPNDIITYYTTLENAIANENEISDPGSYQNGIDPQTIYVRLENEICFATASFLIETENCAPYIPEGFSPSGDGINDEFEISNLLNIYLDFELTIYSRYGNIIYKGGNEEGFWDGITNEGLLFRGSLVPAGVYYYVLVLQDPEYPEPFIGDVYVNY